MAGRFSNLELDDGQNDERLTPEAVAGARRDGASHLAVALQDAQWGQFESALRRYTRCLQEDRTLIPAWVGQVQMLVELGEYREGRMWSDKALELFRNNGDLLAAKAQACARQEDLSAAFVCSDGAMQSPGSSPWRWQARGEVLLAHGQPHHAECFEKALIEPAADWFDRVIVGRIYLYYGRATSALHYFNQALEQQPAHGAVWYHVGQCQQQLGLLGAARSSYHRCLEVRPDYRPAKDAEHALRGTWLWSRLRGLARRWRRR